MFGSDKTHPWVLQGQNLASIKLAYFIKEPIKRGYSHNRGVHL